MRTKLYITFSLTALAAFAQLPLGQDLTSGPITVILSGLAGSDSPIAAHLWMVPGTKSGLLVTIRTLDPATVAFRVTVTYADGVLITAPMMERAARTGKLSESFRVTETGIVARYPVLDAVNDPNPWTSIGFRIGTDKAVSIQIEELKVAGSQVLQ